MIEELLKTYDEQRAKFRPSEEVSIVVWKIDTFVNRIRDLEIEKDALKEDIELLKQTLEWKDGIIADLNNQPRAALERC